MNLSLMTIRVPPKTTASSLFSRLSGELYDRSTGIGFRDLDLEDDGQISGYAAKLRPIFVRVLDLDEGKVVEREEFLLSESFFRIDVGLRIVELHAGPRDARFAAEVFNETIGDVLHLESTTESVSSVLRAMRDSPESYEITRLEINEFVAERGVIGNYNIRTIEAVKAWDFLERYNSQIRTASVLHADLSQQAIVHILGGGRFRFTVRPRSAARDLSDALKRMIVDSRVR